MTDTSITFRVDSDIKSRLAEVTEYYGMDISGAMRALATQIVRTYSLPLTFTPEVPNAETVAALREAEAMVGDGGPWYEDGASLIKAALA